MTPFWNVGSLIVKLVQILGFYKWGWDFDLLKSLSPALSRVQPKVSTWVPIAGEVADPVD